MNRRPGIVALALSLAATAVWAQQPDSVRIPTASFVGRVVSNIDSTPVRSADIRLVFIDSAHTLRDRRGRDSLELFVDSTRSRVGITDSTGAFAIRRLEEGRYVLIVRRIGYEMLQGALLVDTGAVRATLVMSQISKLLAKVVVTETAIDVVKKRLEQNGYVDRTHLGLAAEFVDRAEILRRKPQTVRDILAVYGIYGGTFLLDRMPVDYETVKDYPADLVIGVEIYRHQRPQEFNMTRSVPGILSPGGQAAAMAALVVIWTYIP